MFQERITLKRCAACLLTTAVILMCGVILVSGQKKRQKQPPKYILPEDSVIRLRLNDKLSSKDAQVGAMFSSTVVTPVYVRGVEVIPAGSIVAGHITHV